MSRIYIEALHGSIACNGPHEPLPDYNKEQKELERDSEAIARILNSPRVPVDLRNVLAEAVAGHISNLNDDADYITATWPIAMLKSKAEGSVKNAKD